MGRSHWQPQWLPCTRYKPIALSLRTRGPHSRICSCALCRSLLTTPCIEVRGETHWLGRQGGSVGREAGLSTRCPGFDSLLDKFDKITYCKLFANLPCICLDHNVEHRKPHIFKPSANFSIDTTNVSMGVVVSCYILWIQDFASCLVAKIHENMHWTTTTPNTNLYV